MKTILTRQDRNDLLQLVRQRARVAKAAAAARSADLRADFEAQLDRRYSYDEDATWHAAMAEANAALADGQRRIKARCRELGIPDAFAPSLGGAWMDRGRNATKEERADMRRMAARRIEAIETAAKLQIEQASVAAQERLWADGLTSDAAHEFLASLPTAEQLMPPINLDEVRTALTAPKALASRGLPEIGS